ncbi:hypothetical protein COOONC_23893 [Cooperia oncophora]
MSSQNRFEGSLHELLVLIADKSNQLRDGTNAMDTSFSAPVDAVSAQRTVRQARVDVCNVNITLLQLKSCVKELEDRLMNIGIKLEQNKIVLLADDVQFEEEHKVCNLECFQHFCSSHTDTVMLQ